MYLKPRLVRYGSLRELTLLGAGPDCDGGPAMGDGSTTQCNGAGGAGRS